MERSSDETRIAGVVGSYVGADGAGARWEVRISPHRLAQLLAAAGAGQAIEVASPRGTYAAYARRWSVLPAGKDLLVRLTLEKSASA